MISLSSLLRAFVAAYAALLTGCTASPAPGPANSDKALPTPVPSPSVQTSVFPAAPASILFIVDSSGSMKAKSGSTTKMEEAKKVVNELIGQLPSGTNAGLMVYGHRRKNDCSDVELVVPVGPIQARPFAEKVNALQPVGETPISYSIREAAAAMKPIIGRKTIILISDGEETCKEDPCAVAAELKKADIDLQVHVVGFGIDTAVAKKQLHCIAEATGGGYNDAGDAAELQKVLEGIATAAGRRVNNGTLVTIGSNVDGEPLDYHIEIYHAGRQETVDPGGVTWKSTKANEVLPGTYDIKYWSPTMATIWKRNVEIKPGETTTVDLGRFGRVRVTIKDQNDSELALYGYVFDGSNPEEQIATMYQGVTTKDLPPGTYDIKFWNVGISEWKKGVEVKPGQETAISVTVNK